MKKIFYYYSITFVFFLLVLAGCSKGTQDTDIKILKPADGEVIKGTDITIAIQTKNLVVKKAGDAPEYGEGHFHISLDDGQYIMIFSNTYVLREVSPGEHELEVELRNNDHTAYNPPIEKKVRFTTKQ